MANEIWFTADTHFGHGNRPGEPPSGIIKHCSRPFADVDEMDAALTDSWNAVVRPGDQVWHLGDFSWGDHPKWLKRLNGDKHLVKGNHDKSAEKAKWTSVSDYMELTVEGRQLVLFHYGMRVWKGHRRGAIHLYGHSHGRLPGFRLPGGGGCIDVGTDCWNYRPVNLEEIRQAIAALPPVGFDEVEDGPGG